MGNRKSREIAQDYLDRRMRTLLEIRDRAQKVQEKLRKQEKADLVTPGKAVWLIPAKKGGKLAPRFRGPFIVLENCIRNMILIRSVIEDDSELRVHIRRVVPIIGEHSMDELKKMAASGEGEYVIQTITNHRGEDKETLMFLVQWLGYDPSESTWEYLWNVKDSIALENYLKEHPELVELVE
ncbi:hypothetical protein ADUPG1_001741 [Aduncisulcus paluster]|uniref:Chromo domain-containing protein n=1 Tax=Aduncisulcus paluster TaxID=2918883 RepID=A0ABQ5KHV9_9EUKA|nr:hypothetical protein ADUPG1_001741 [Aduncisulcus paluster]